MKNMTLPGYAHGYYGSPSVYVNNGNIQMTRTTQFNYHGAFPQGGHGGRHHHHKHSYSHTERPPKLWRYCTSCGLLDSGAASRMSSGEMCGEAVKCVGYASRELGSTVCGMAHDVCGIVEGLGGAAVGACQVIVGVAQLVAGLFGNDQT